MSEEKKEEYNRQKQANLHFENLMKIDNVPAKEFHKYLPKIEGYQPEELLLAADLLFRMLKWNPADRCSCEQALAHNFFHKFKTTK